ncbi:peptidyl-prolyl cis-trans isomerase [Striga asiatica]|uniref:peptidylprolyl isomerase n=1 Tax=Striga asiatica TaxID=4170 RepID=A0A5A7PQH7_STRAF|nr:peptidyl-prolyl cis-trans isomerase [Striga asiatica]
MAFWGIEVEPGKPYFHYSDDEKGRLHVSQAALGAGSSTKSSILQCKVGDKKPICLCSLLPEKIETCALNLEFEEGEEATFSIIGSHRIEVEPGKPYVHYSDEEKGRLHVSQETLGAGSSTKKRILQCKVGDKKPIYLCSLLPEKLENCALNLEFDEGEEATFSIIGSHNVRLSGFFYGDNENQDNLEDDYGLYPSAFVGYVSAVAKRPRDGSKELLVFEPLLLNEASSSRLPISSGKCQCHHDEASSHRRRPEPHWVSVGHRESQSCS